MILPIVEGRSEVEAVPVLLRRLLGRLGRSAVPVAKPFRVGRYLVVKPGEIERALVQGIRARNAVTSVVVLLDADDDDPPRVEATLLARCRTATSLPAAVVLARRELESWFLGSKDSLRGIRGIRSTANAPANPEEIRGAKERLSANMDGRRYLPVDDQPAFAERMDLDSALARCPSFMRLSNELERILAECSD